MASDEAPPSSVQLKRRFQQVFGSRASESFSQEAAESSSGAESVEVYGFIVRPPHREASDACVRNVLAHMAHYLRIGDAKITACGRPVLAHHEALEVENAMSEDQPRCKL